MSGRISASRASAVKAAQQAKARRDAERLRRERQVEAALADFYEQTGKAGQLRANASVRAARILADAEAAAIEPERRAREAVMALYGLGETRDQIAELTGLSLVEVRAVLAEFAGPGKPQPGGRDVEVTASADPRLVDAAVAGSGGIGAG